jgi:Flp pilus assembly protein TadD
MHALAPRQRRLLLTVAVLSGLGAPGFASPSAQEEVGALDERIERLIAQLGDDDYWTRERAQQALAELGFDAYDALSAAATHDDLEIASRARYLLRLIQAQWSIENEPEEVREYLAYYHSYSDDVRIQVLRMLAHWPRRVALPSLCRLIRFEKSTVWSKIAAIEVLHAEPADEQGRRRWTQTLREHLGRSGRPAVRWLVTYLDLSKAPGETLPQWKKLVDEEIALLEQSSDQSSPRVAAALLYYQALAELAAGEPESAEKTAERARTIGPEASTERLQARVDVALALQQRGRFDWALREYRTAAEAGQPRFVVKAQTSLSEMLHEQGDHLAAAEARRVAVELVDARKVNSDEAVNLSAGQLRARMHYFFARHWEKEADRRQQRRHLDEAVESDPDELDSLIARYRLPEPEPDYHRKTLELIEQAASRLRAQIADAPDRASLCNQLAWLIGNTEGDFDEALRCAQKAVELRPESGSLMDTLAHVYFARGERQKAVETQERAAELEPHSALILGQLDYFRKALEEAEAGPRQVEKPANPDPKAPEG